MKYREYERLRERKQIEKNKKAKELSKDSYISHLEQSIESVKSDCQRKLKNKQRALKKSSKVMKKHH